MNNKKNKLIIPLKLKIFLIFVFVLLFVSYTKIFALGGTGPFSPGTELDPGCAPGSVNCIIIPDNLSLNSQIIGFISNSGIVSDSDTLIGALGKLDANINSKVSSQWISSTNDIYYNSGRVWIGADSENTSSSSLYISGTTSANGPASSAISGIFGNYTFNPTLGGVQVGNRYVINNNPTSLANTAVGSIYRVIDNTTLTNLVRGLDITSNAGTNTFGVNTGLRSNGATFGIQAITTALAGGTYVPAAIYGESTGTTQGDILRLYSKTMTTAPAYATFYHDTSSYEGTGLLMDFATGSGTFTGNFVDFQNNNASLFKVTSDGFLNISLPSITATSAICSSLPNGTSPVLGIAYEIRDCSSTPVADYAEMYPVETDVEYGDIVVIGEDDINTYDTDKYGVIDFNTVKGKVKKLVKSNEEYQEKVIGIVSLNYGDFSSVGYNIKKEDNPMPVALNGRVPVKISKNSDQIKAGDYLTTSTDEGMAMKANNSGFVIGKALEDWDGLSDTIMVFVEQGYRSNYSLKVSDESLYEKSISFFDSIIDTIDSIIFRKVVEFESSPIFNNDMAGYATITAGQNIVDVIFNTSYNEAPFVNVSPILDSFVEMPKYIVTNITENGFSIELENPIEKYDVKFSWISLNIKDGPVNIESFIEAPEESGGGTGTCTSIGTDTPCSR